MSSPMSSDQHDIVISDAPPARHNWDPALFIDLSLGPEYALILNLKKNHFVERSMGSGWRHRGWYGWEKQSVQGPL